MEQHFSAFISYRHLSPDQEVAKWLHTAIETYGIPASVRRQTGRKTMGKCFRDREELPLSPSLGDDIERALLQSDWFIAVCTPRYQQSPWCMREMEFFAAHKGRERILVVLAEGSHSESIPDMLCWRRDENGSRVPYQPLAAEARGETMAARVKKLRVEKFRILAPMLGVGFDDLRRRARQRRMRIGAAVAASALAAGIALGSWAAYNRAKNERLEQEAAEQQRIAQAEALRAAENRIGESLERSASLTGAQERLRAGAELLSALDVSEANGGLRREEILSALRKAMYIQPFTPVSGFTGENLRLLSIDPSPEGRLAAGIVNNNSVAIIDLWENALCYQVSLDNNQISGPRFAPDGSRFFAVCDEGRLITVWNTADGTVAFSYTSRADERYQIANAFFWGDADTLLVQDMDRFLLVSSDGSERLLYTMGQFQDEYNPRRNILTAATGRSLKQLITLRTEDYTGTPAAATPDRSRLLIAGRAGETGTLILDREGALVTPLAGMPGTMAEQYALSDDGATAACLSAFGFYAGWDGETGELLYFCPLEVEGGAFTGSAPVFSPDGKTLSFVAGDTLHMADARTGELLVKGTLIPSSYVPELSYSADGAYLFIAEQSLYIVDRQGRLWALYEAEAAAPYTNAVQLGDRMLVTRGDGSAAVYCMPEASALDIRPLSELPELCPADRPQEPPEGLGQLHLAGEHRLSDAFKAGAGLRDLSPQLWFSADGSMAALSYPDGVIELFNNPASGAVSAMFGQLTQEITALGMSDTRLIASDAGGRLMFADPATGEVLRILNNEAACLAFAFSPAGDRLMALRSDGALDVYELEDPERLFTLRSALPFTDFGFAADGSAAVGVTEEGGLCARLWTDEAELLAYARALCARE